MKSIVGTIDRVAFSFGPFTVYWYGIIIGAAMLLAITLASKEGKKRGLGEEDITDMAMWAIPLGLIGARIYYVLFQWEYYIKKPLEIIAIWQGGIAIYGGLIAGGAGRVLVHEEKRDPFFIDARYTGALCSVGAVHWPMGELYQPGGPWGSSDPHLFGEPLPAKVYY